MISVVLAVHNEANNIKRCLDSVKDFADEIIVVDGESTDETVKIAQSFKAKIISTTNKANFHINKQLGLDAAKGELVLQLDADEVVDIELAKFIDKIHEEIPELVRDDNASSHKAWWLKRKNLFLGRWLKKGGQYPDPVIRLYVNGFARLPSRDVHEQMQVDGRVGWAEGHLLHYSNPTFADYLEKFNRYTSFKAQQLENELIPKGPFWGLINSINYLLIKPFATWFSLYLRHKGFMDGFPGFVFALFSGLHHLVAYLKLWELKRKS